ncbi:UDP-glucose 4-epimerase family protein [Candidatus Symbiobacter mobilis]|uniref:Nucleoside-diphosphate-sugar epimerase n=1 Tax=Candidatus Symbiobacter mobilis CR TaxID=946483 RepID=U5NCB8_9BURK|nr:SDR family oxidoreductase [Candidatus Symbiobacter mobilis]AGX87853.1 nucleoside-diphosphate-sugar epimerase [Candidatus Symbiobacter mobilis CR]
MTTGMTVLVTGANGWIGQALCARLRREGVDVRAAIRKEGAGTRTGVETGVETRYIIVGDIGADTDWSPALAGVDTVVHLAARVHQMRETAPDPLAAYRQTNVDATRKLVRDAARCGVRRFVFLSSVKVMGECSPVGQPFREADMPQPQDHYGRSKFEAETALWQEAGAMEAVVLRPPLVYGPGVRANFAALLRAVRQGWPLPVGSVDARRSLVALDNLVDALCVAMRHPRAAGEVFFVSDGQDLSVADLVRMLAQAMHRAPRIVPVPVELLHCAGWCAGKAAAVERLCSPLQVDSTKLRTMLGWIPPLSLEEGLRQTVEGTE